MGESNTVVSAYTLYRHLQQYCSHLSIYVFQTSSMMWQYFWIRHLLVIWAPEMYQYRPKCSIDCIVRSILFLLLYISYFFAQFQHHFSCNTAASAPIYAFLCFSRLFLTMLFPSCWLLSHISNYLQNKNQHRAMNESCTNVYHQSTESHWLSLVVQW